MKKFNLRRLIERFAKNRQGSVAMIFSLSFIPVLALVGVGVDYGRGIALGAKVQSAIDEANLASTGLTGAARQTFITNMITAAFADEQVTLTGPTFSTTSSGAYRVDLTVTIPTKIIQAAIPSFSTMSTTKSSMVMTGVAGTAGTPGTIGATDNACIFTTGEMLTVATDTLTFNGSPSVQLSGCSIRSNTSIKCNGGNIGAQDAYAVGSIDGSCTSASSYNHPGQGVMPDIWSSIYGANVALQCGTTHGGYTWTAGTGTTRTLPAAGTNVKYVTKSDFTEIHICGDLTLTGSAANQSLTGSTPSTDTVVIVENGGVIMANSSTFNAFRMTFVLSGGSVGNSPVVSWPTGTGSKATVVATSSMTSANPWAGIVFYQNPSTTYNSVEDTTWKPGANLSFDGTIYFPQAQFTVSGSMSFGPVGCSKIVAGEFTLNGNVNLKQSASACATQGVAQYSWAGNPGIPAVAATSTRLTLN